jgi:hypothetical protein
MSTINKNDHATNVKKVCESQELGSLLSLNSFTQVQTTHYTHKLVDIAHINWKKKLKRKVWVGFGKSHIKENPFCDFPHQ